MTLDYFKKVHLTYIENWGKALSSLSVMQTDIPLSPVEARALARANRGLGPLCDRATTRPVELLVQRIDAALRAYPAGAFVRLGSRSAKDSRYALRRGLRVTDGQAAISMLTEGSQRVAFDLRLASLHGYQSHIFVRQWCDIPAWAELRCFMRGRQLIGISQYDCRNLGHCPEIAGNAERIRSAIAVFFEKIRLVSPLDDVVFDVFVLLSSPSSDDPVAVTLLELNPFFHRTDACLFTWRNGGDFDGSFRFL
jgi:hypothetical protein